jgi:adenine-specific DNA-methyltransferase
MKIGPEIEPASMNLSDVNRQILSELFPEAFIEGKDGPVLDVEVLMAIVGMQPAASTEEKYGLNWHGKREARRIALSPSNATLRPCRADSPNWDTSKNLMIEGDNLEVLKLLQKSFSGKVKMIYIDPPYNTGRDFVYPDDFQDSVQNYLELTGQVKDGAKISSNTESSGRFHTDWLNMMYPRLKLARELLRKDGVIFISIDDGEVRTLRLLCDEIFGEENFFAQIPWQSRTSVQNDTDISIQHEYIVGYARNRRREHRRLKEMNADIWFTLDSFAAFPLPLDESRYDNPDKDPRGKWKADPFDAPNIRENLTYAIVNPRTGVKHFPPPGRHWRTEQEKFNQLLADNRIVFGKSGESRPQLKVFYNENMLYGEVPTSWFGGETYGTATGGTQELQTLFGGQSPFSFPKPTKLIAALVRLATRGDDIVMDFFAGSGTTGHAIMSQNLTDSGHRRFILVQLPETLNPENKEEQYAAELCDRLKKPRNLAEITKERLRLAANQLTRSSPLHDVDFGFRAFRLDSTNMHKWEPRKENLTEAVQMSIDHIKSDRTEDDILFEIMLKLGIDPCTPVEILAIPGTSDISRHVIQSVGGGILMACLSNEIAMADVESIGNAICGLRDRLSPVKETTCVFRDNSFPDDVAKTNLVEILRQHGGFIVKSV